MKRKQWPAFFQLLKHCA